MNIRLDNDKQWRYQWITNNGISVIGYAWHKGKLLQNEMLTAVFKDIRTAEDFSAILQDTDGHFSVIVETPDYCFAAVDRMRTFPLFITTENGKTTITNALQYNGLWNAEAIAAFQKIYCTPGNITLLQACLQLQAGEYAEVRQSDGSFQIREYNIAGNSNLAPNPDRLRQLEVRMVQRIVEYANGRTIVLPLSGGYDARYLLCLLKTQGVADILCFTYGKADSYEVETARKVTQQLDIPWHFVEYNNELLDVFFTETWQYYSDGNHHYTSLPHEQDFFALYELRHKNILPENAIVINGFCQDVWAGSMLTAPEHQDFRKHIAQKFDYRLPKDIPCNTTQEYEKWLQQNRLSKFIVNAVHAYTFFGMDFYLPFWEKEWMHYWQSLPLKERLYQQYYKTYVFSNYFEPLKTAFHKPAFDESAAPHPLKQWLKENLPQSWVQAIQRKKQQQTATDSNNTLYLYRAILDKMQFPPATPDFRINNIHALYFLEKLQDKTQL